MQLSSFFGKHILYFISEQKGIHPRSIHYGAKVWPHKLSLSTQARSSIMVALDPILRDSTSFMKMQHFHLWKPYIYSKVKYLYIMHSCCNILSTLYFLLFKVASVFWVISFVLSKAHFLEFENFLEHLDFTTFQLHLFLC